MRSAIESAMGKERSLLSDLEEKSKTISAIEMEKSTIASSLESKQSTLEILRWIPITYLLFKKRQREEL